MIKLVVTDLDGTLLDRQSNLSELNKKAIDDCRKNGIGVILATGKSVAAIGHLIEMLSLKLPQITLNGSVVVDSSFNVVKSTKLGQKYFYDLLGTIKEKKYNPLVALENGKIIYDRYDPSFEVFKAIDEPLSVVKQLENDEYAKMCVSVGTVIEESDPLDDFLRKKYGKVLQIIRSGKYFFDILNRDASKGKSLEFICQAYGIKKEEVAVIGDSPNDLSMFEYSRISIAVKNSYPEVSKKADFITDENYNDGFAKAIYKYILK